MELTEDENIEKHGTLCKLFNWICLIPYEYEFTCFACGYNLMIMINYTKLYPN